MFFSARTRLQLPLEKSINCFKFRFNQRMIKIYRNYFEYSHSKKTSNVHEKLVCRRHNNLNWSHLSGTHYFGCVHRLYCTLLRAHWIFSWSFTSVWDCASNYRSEFCQISYWNFLTCTKLHSQACVILSTRNMLRNLWMRYYPIHTSLIENHSREPRLQNFTKYYVSRVEIGVVESPWNLPLIPNSPSVFS